MLSVIMLNVVTLSVVATKKQQNQMETYTVACMWYWYSRLANDRAQFSKIIWIELQKNPETKILIIPCQLNVCER
jgi:hypothetical protein